MNCRPKKFKDYKIKPSLACGEECPYYQVCLAEIQGKPINKKEAEKEIERQAEIIKEKEKNERAMRRKNRQIYEKEWIKKHREKRKCRQ